jgi:hypothetical protein
MHTIDEWERICNFTVAALSALHKMHAITVEHCPMSLIKKKLFALDGEMRVPSLIILAQILRPPDLPQIIARSSWRASLS